MNMHDLEQMLEHTQPLKAPANFTQQVMAQIQQSETRSAPSSRAFYLQWGLSCLAASLVVLFINLTPILDFAKTNVWMEDVHHGSGVFSMESIPEALDSFTTEASRFFTRPLNTLANTFRKDV